MKYSYEIVNMTEESLNIITYKQFLNICQKNEVNKLKKLIEKCNLVEWTKYRHAISGDTGLHLAAQNGHINIVKLLCECSKNLKSDINIMNVDHKRPLHDAAQFARPEIIKILIHQGAVVNTFKKADWTPLMLACTKSGKDAEKCVELLLEAGADPFLKNKDGWTAFFMACRTGDYDIINLMLDKFGSMCVKDKSKNDRTALHICAFHKHLKVTELLVLKYSSLLECRDSVGCTPLHEAIKSGDLTVIQQLIELRANTTVVDNSGRSILHLAAACKNAEIFNYILRNNLVDVHLKDSFGNTAHEIAEKNKVQDIY